jgi:hypothetical protein
MVNGTLPLPSRIAAPLLFLKWLRLRNEADESIQCWREVQAEQRMS